MVVSKEPIECNIEVKGHSLQIVPRSTVYCTQKDGRRTALTEALVLQQLSAVRAMQRERYLKAGS